ncbi:hypothetical protein AtEden1_Chr3g0198281 [Arabidopsis thaliana]
MSCFKLPQDLCKKLTSVMTEFWWSSGNDRNKIPWVAWKKLCRKKEDGGLGFHDIVKFNQALLCKQAWRLLDQPQSLLARFLKSRYFREKSFLDCGVGTRPSYAWRSIFHGRELLKKGLKKFIGNGQNLLEMKECRLTSRIHMFGASQRMAFTILKVVINY